MQTVEQVVELRAAVRQARASGLRIGFVPTMGFLHEGHLSLIDDARRRAGFVVMSVFVNPLQFAPGEDLSRYPRDAAGDSAKARGRGVDLLFTPAAEAMYPRARRVDVVPSTVPARWEGAVRPGHFGGVLTVVAKLLNIVQPDVTIFGQKDVQQATLVRAMVDDLNFPTEIVVAPTAREPDGLAMASRNSFLDAADRARATVLSRALFAMRERFRHGEVRVDSLLTTGRALLNAEQSVAIDYLAIADAATLQPLEIATSTSVAIVAARVGGTRLIDNVVLGE